MSRGQRPQLRNGVNQSFQNGDYLPPRSTLAAQIVQNRTETTREEPGNQALFGRLLQEYLKDYAQEESSIETNAQLILVVAEHGLDLPQDGVELTEQARQHVHDSLKVVRLTVERKPEVLFHCDGSSAKEKPILFVWLLVRLIGVTGHAEGRFFHHSIQDLLAVCLRASESSPSSWQKSFALHRLMQSAVNDILTCLDSASSRREQDSTPIKLMVPTLDTIALVWSPAQTLIALQTGYQYSVDSPDKVRHLGQVALTLLNALALVDSGAMGLSSSSDRMQWMTDAVRRVLHTHSGVDESRSKPERVPSRALQTLRLMLDQQRSSNPSSGVLRSLNECSAAMFKGMDLWGAPAYPDLASYLMILHRYESKGLRRSTIVKSSVAGTVQVLNDDTPGVTGESPELGLTMCIIQHQHGLIDVDPIHYQEAQFDESWKAENTEALDLMSDSDEDSDNNSNEQPPFKRRKLSRSYGWQARIAKRQYAKMGHLLDLEISSSFNLKDVTDDFLGAQDEAFYTSLLDACRLYICASANCLIRRMSSSARVLCRCQGITHTGQRIVSSDAAAQAARALLGLFHRLTSSEGLRKSRKARVLLAKALCSLLIHSGDASLADISSPMGQWLLRSLQSSVRELRLAATKSLSAYLLDDIPMRVVSQNRRTILSFLKTLSDRNNIVEQETLVSAWKAVALCCGPEERELCLNQLVEYLGHSHLLVSSAAYDALLKLASELGGSIGDMFKPYWKTLAINVVQDLIRSPQKAQQLAEVQNISVTDLLCLTQMETLPFLVLTRKTDILQRIAQARGGNTSRQDLLLQPSKHLAAVLAALLMQQNSDPESFIKSMLGDAAPGMEEQELVTLINVEAILTACYILKAGAQGSDEDGIKAQYGMHNLAFFAERRANQQKPTKNGKHLEAFLETHILGIMTHFSDILDLTKDAYSTADRVQALKALQHLIMLAGSQLTAALPQLKATLYTTIYTDSEPRKLIDPAFATWTTLISLASEEDVELVIDQTFAIITEKWTLLSEQSQMRAHELIADLLKRHNALIRDRIEMIPDLHNIEILKKFNSEFTRLKAVIDPLARLEGFVERIQDENPSIVHLGLIELGDFMFAAQQAIHNSILSQQPAPAIGQLYRALLDAIVRAKELSDKETSDPILDLCAQNLGMLGCVDPNLIDISRDKREMLMLANFEKASEVIEFVATMFETVLVKAFHSASTARGQRYLAYVMQELLQYCGFRTAAVTRYRASQAAGDTISQIWRDFPEHVRTTLTPFLKSKYFVVQRARAATEFPIFRPTLSRADWLRTFVYELLYRAKNLNAQAIFTYLSRIIRDHDVAISSFLLPFVVQNAVIGANTQEISDIQNELNAVLGQDVTGMSQAEVENVKQCSEDVFKILDYLSRWLQEKRRVYRRYATGSNRDAPAEFDEFIHVSQVSSIERLLAEIPAQVIAQRAGECGSFARAIFHFEQYLRNRKPTPGSTDSGNEEFSKLQALYAGIEEPDAVEGIASQLQILSPEQQVIAHKRAGRWNAAQSFYEVEVGRHPEDLNVHRQLLACLKNQGQYDGVLNHVSAHIGNDKNFALLASAAEAAWNTGKWSQYKDLFATAGGHKMALDSQFNADLADVMTTMMNPVLNTEDHMRTRLSEARIRIAQTVTSATTESLSSARSVLLKLHALEEIDLIDYSYREKLGVSAVKTKLDNRLGIMGAFVDDKQYVLGIQRAGLAWNQSFAQVLSSSWLNTARLAKETNRLNIAYDAVMHATALGDPAAHIDYAKLLYDDGQPRKAIEVLKIIIATSPTPVNDGDSMAVTMDGVTKDHNQILGDTQLLLANWMDEAGLIEASQLIDYYHQAQRSWNRSTDMLYCMAKYYNKIFEAEKAAARHKQKPMYLSGECTKLAIDNYLRSMVFGSKHYYETVPKVITLWLDLASEVHDNKVAESKRRTSSSVGDSENNALKIKRLDAIHKQIKKYAERLPAYVFYSALPQMMSRIAQPLADVSALLTYIVTRVISTYPQQSLWGILALAKSKNIAKRRKAEEIITQLKLGKNEKGVDLKTLIQQGQRLTEALLVACEVPIDGRASSIVSLYRDLHFNLKLAPCDLVVPVEKSLIATLPLGSGGAAVRSHQPFAQKPITISSFSDEVLVLNSLQRPRKLTIRGSDGQTYGILCKPKDDLRKDQRLMEFNAMICRALKWNNEANKRRLYIRMYAVTPLNEECGAIEWVDGLKPMRDIVLELYKTKGIKPNYTTLRDQLDKANDKSVTGHQLIFTRDVLPQFPPVLYEWFIDNFPAPDTWFAARLRYARSCAVMSIVGHVLGLGDRHGENILLEEGNGGVFHVDFNCLFDKGLTFEKPEMVPFRLTHNMVHAFGPYKQEGPYRTAAELTLRVLRQHQETLMTIMETFLYDPTTDFAATNKPKKKVPHVPETPKEILDSVKAKIKGYLAGENLPLSVDGYVGALVQRAMDPARLAAMYIGWCAFF